MTHLSTASTRASKTTPWWQLDRLNNTVKIAIALIGMLLTLTGINLTIAKYEAHLATGDTVLLELAPVDPRGFMQGDYMALRFAIEEDILEALKAINKEYTWRTYDGIAIIKKDENGVGHFVRLTDDKTIKAKDLEINETPLHFRLRHNQIRFATNAFFFQEGHAEAYEAAEYGLFRVNESGEPLLTDMVDDEFEVILPE